MGWELKQDIELVLAKIFTDRGVRIPSAEGHRGVKEALRGKGSAEMTSPRRERSCGSSRIK